jgi:hypothetical protein
VVDLHEDKDFQGLGVELLSISPDPIDAWREAGRDMGIRNFNGILTDAENQVAGPYGVMQWAAGGEPGHTFILVDESGEIAWLQGRTAGSCTSCHMRLSDWWRATCSYGAISAVVPKKTTAVIPTTPVQAIAVETSPTAREARRDPIAGTRTARAQATRSASRTVARRSAAPIVSGRPPRDRPEVQPSVTRSRYR